jgi:hypothetical protein
LVDWRQRSLRALETTIDWLLDFLSPTGVLVVWVDRQKSADNQELPGVFERRGLAKEATTTRANGSALSARRRTLAGAPSSERQRLCLRRASNSKINRDRQRAFEERTCAATSAR